MCVCGGGKILYKRISENCWVEKKKINFTLNPFTIKPELCAKGLDT